MARLFLVVRPRNLGQAFIPSFLSEIGIPLLVRHTHRLVAGISLKGNQDGSPMTTVGNDLRGEIPTKNPRK